MIAKQKNKAHLTLLAANEHQGETVKNKHGLSRDIPDSVKAEVRKRSKFGCVLCRAAFYDYEHIKPTFSDAIEHDPDNICCLCPSCHSKVTRGIYSKEKIRLAYERISAASITEVSRPMEAIDFHDGKAELLIGGISYEPGVTSIVKYHGHTVFSVSPAATLGSAGINAIFYDDKGEETLRIEGNALLGSLNAWDMEVVGRRIKVRRNKGSYSAVLRIEPPGRIVIERLDMRLVDAHILASEETCAAGRYISRDEIVWFHANVACMAAPLPDACAIEFLTSYEAEWRDLQWKHAGMETPGGRAAFRPGLGLACKPIGIIVAANCLVIDEGSSAMGGPRPLQKMRSVVFNNPDKVAQYICTGVL